MTYTNDKSGILPTHHHHHHYTGVIDESDVELHLGDTDRVWKAIKRIVQVASLALLGTALYFALFSAVWCPSNPDGSFPSDCLIPNDIAVPEAPSSPSADHLVSTPVPVAAWKGHKTHEAYTVYPLYTDKDIYISVQGGKTEVVVSRLPDMTPDQSGGIGVQMIFEGEGHESLTMFMVSDHESHLTVEGRAKTVHRVYILLPAALTHLPRLQITASQLSFDLKPSTLKVKYDVLKMSTDMLVSLAPELPAADDIEIDVVEGSIEGTFNISRRLSLHTQQGDITAQVHVVGDGQPEPGPHIEARTQEGNVDLTIASLPPDVDASIAGLTTMGDVSVDLASVPAFFGQFSALTSDGCINVYTEDEHKALHFTQDRPGHVEGYVEPAAPAERLACGELDLQPTYTIQTGQPDRLRGGPGYTIQTDPSYPEPTFTIQTDPLAPEPTFTIQTGKLQGEPTFTIQTDPPYPEPTFTIQTGDVHAEPSYTIQTDPLSPEPTFTIQTGQLQGDPTFTIQTDPPYPDPTSGTQYPPAYKSTVPKGGLVRAQTEMGTISLNL